MRKTPPDDLLDLIFVALDNAVTSITGTNGPLIPFVIIEALSGERTLARFTTGKNPDEARQHAQSHVSGSHDCRKYAVAADGTITEKVSAFLS
jgi:hypothetical protein